MIIHKQLELYYSTLNTPFSPALVVAHDIGSSGPYVMYLTDGHTDGKINIRAWTVDGATNKDTDVQKTVECLGLHNTYSISTAEFSKQKDTSALEVQCIANILEAVSVLYSSQERFCNQTIDVDFWRTHLPEENRPYNHKGVEGFTYNALKSLWKILGKGGHSNKSKADLFEGFAETAVEISGSDAADKFLNAMPKRMIAVKCTGRPSSAVGSDVKEPSRMLAMISRVAAGVLFAVDHSPDIDERNIIDAYRFVDLKDPYADMQSLKTFESEAEAMDSLSRLYEKREK